MYVKIKKYKSYFGPYQLAEKLCFWAKKEKDEFGFKRTPDWVHNFGEWLAHGSVEPDPKPGEITKLFSDREERHYTWVYRLLNWIQTLRGERYVKVRIDPWDTWNMDHTLALIALPMLKQLKETKNSGGSVVPEDVPEELRPTEEELEELTINGQTDPNFFKRWDWVLDEMIFAFEHIVDQNWETEYTSGEFDLRTQVCKWDENGKPLLHEMIEGPNHTYKIDHDGIAAINKRIDNGLMLFGKYYRSLWD